MTDLLTLIAGPKRHAEFFAEGPTVTDISGHTESVLGGFYCDPPTMCGRAHDGGRLWTLAATQREVEYRLARHYDPEVLRPSAPWDRPGELPFPALRRLVVVTAEVARTLPQQVRRPGTRYLEGVGSRLRRGSDPAVVALDPGGDLRDCFSLGWLDRRTGEKLRVTTDPEDLDAVLLDTLDQRTIDWATRLPAPPLGRVTIRPDRIRIMGAVSAVIDADLDGLGEPASCRPVYLEPDREGFVVAEARSMGKREFMRRARLSEGVSQRAASGKRISSRNVDRAFRELTNGATARTCALAGCDEPVTTAQARYCGKAHTDKAYRLRRRAGPAVVEADGEPSQRLIHPMCAHCGTILLGRAAERGTCSLHSEE